VDDRHAHKNGVSCVNLSENMRFVVSAGYEGEIRVWEIKTKEMISHLKEHISKVNACSLFTNDQYCISASRDRCILTWDLRAERRLTLHREKHGGINSMVVCNDQTTVLSAGQEKTLSIWDLRVADCVKSVQLDEELHKIAISHDDKYLVTGGDGCCVKLWDTRKLEKKNSFLVNGTGHSKCIRGLEFSEDDKQVVSVSDDWSALVWNIYDIDDSELKSYLLNPID